MTSRFLHCLLRTYPSPWREKHGEELAATLKNSPLSLRVITDILFRALQERWRSIELWKIAGILDALWLIFGTALNSVHPLSAASLSRFSSVESLIMAVVGFWYVSRYACDSISAAIAAAKAASLGAIPEAILGVLWASGMVHPTILGTNGVPYGRAGLMTVMSIRMDGNPSPAALFVVLLFTVAGGFVFGLIGAFAARLFASRLRRPQENQSPLERGSTSQSL